MVQLTIQTGVDHRCTSQQRAEVVNCKHSNGVHVRERSQCEKQTPTATTIPPPPPPPPPPTMKGNIEQISPQLVSARCGIIHVTENLVGIPGHVGHHAQQPHADLLKEVNISSKHNEVSATRVELEQKRSGAKSNQSNRDNRRRNKRVCTIERTLRTKRRRTAVDQRKRSICPQTPLLYSDQGGRQGNAARNVDNLDRNLENCRPREARKCPVSCSTTRDSTDVGPFETGPESHPCPHAHIQISTHWSRTNIPLHRTSSIDYYSLCRREGQQ